MTKFREWGETLKYLEKYFEYLLNIWHNFGHTGTFALLQLAKIELTTLQSGHTVCGVHIGTVHIICVKIFNY